MSPTSLGRHLAALFGAVFLLSFFVPVARAQTCESSSEMDARVLAAITTAGQRYFDMAARNDAASLKQNAIPTLVPEFGGIENLLKERQTDLAGAQATVKNALLLDNDQGTPNTRAEFYCGVFGKNGQTASSSAFYLDNLPPARYAVVLLDATSAQSRIMFSEVLQQVGNDWKLGGLYIKPAQIGAHDSSWFLTQARQYKSKGRTHNAWLYYIEARNLTSPVPFMSTLATDKLYDESQSLQPADLPAAGKTADLLAGNTTYKLTAAFPEAVGNDLDLIVRYQSADASNTNQAYQDNVNVIKALVAKYPELRDAFAAVVARAVDASGRDYGTLLAMKDIK